MEDGGITSDWADAGVRGSPSTNNVSFLTHPLLKTSVTTLQPQAGICGSERKMSCFFSFPA